MDNSYNDVEFDIPVAIPAITGANVAWTDGSTTYKPCYYVGFKSASDMFDQYGIYSNGDLVYTQNHPYCESFINYISLTDSAKENSECFATMKKIKARKSNVPGIYVEFADGQSKDLTITAHLKFKILVSMFMMLANLK